MMQSTIQPLFRGTPERGDRPTTCHALCEYPVGAAIASALAACEVLVLPASLTSSMVERNTSPGFWACQDTTFQVCELGASDRMRFSADYPDFHAPDALLPPMLH
jgi:hypothetical protein